MVFSKIVFHCVLCSSVSISNCRQSEEQMNIFRKTGKLVRRRSVGIARDVSAAYHRRRVKTFT